MTRQNKFRAWYEKSQGWAYFDVGMGFTEEGYLVYKELLADKAIFYQFTGRLDKNEREIYESDILNIVGYSLFQEVVMTGCRTSIRSVPDNDDFEDLYGIPQYELEIIGDIRQNPELINQTKIVTTLDDLKDLQKKIGITIEQVKGVALEPIQWVPRKSPFVFTVAYIASGLFLVLMVLISAWLTINH